MAPPPFAVGSDSVLRSRTHLVLLVLLFGCWLLPWEDVTTQGGVAVRRPGLVSGGAVAALALIALWGTALTAQRARDRRGLRLGAALTDGTLALAAAGLLAAEHPWLLLSGDAASLGLPVFVPLALLAFVDAASLLRAGSEPRGEPAIVRAGAALFAAGTLTVDGVYLLAGLCLWIGVSALLVWRLDGPRGAPRAIRGLSLAAALFALFAPEFHRVLVGLPASPVTWYGRDAWRIVAALLVASALRDLIGAFRRPAPAPDDAV